MHEWMKIHRDKNALEENTNSNKNAVIIQNNGGKIISISYE